MSLAIRFCREIYRPIFLGLGVDSADDDEPVTTFKIYIVGLELNQLSGSDPGFQKKGDDREDPRFAGTHRTKDVYLI